MEGEDIRIRVDIRIGRGKENVWKCDMKKEYVEIKGDYRR